MNPYVNDGLCVVLKCPRRFLSGNKCPTPVGDIDDREKGQHVSGVGVCGENSCTFLLILF